MTPIDFKPVLNQTLHFEGGYTVDNGGPTNYGVRQDIYDAYAKKNNLPSKNIKSLNYGEVKEFYQKEYWDRPKISKLPKGISANVFDYGVNAGQAKAISALQEVVGTKADGVIGPKTLKAVDKYLKAKGEALFNQEFLNKRVEHYNTLVAQDPKQYGRYLPGWLNRVNKLSTR